MALVQPHLLFDIAPVHCRDHTGFWTNETFICPVCAHEMENDLVSGLCACANTDCEKSKKAYWLPRRHLYPFMEE